MRPQQTPPLQLVVACLALGALGGACGSGQATSSAGAACTRTSDCQSGLLCAVTGVCTAPDSGPADTGKDAADSGGLDASSPG